MTQASNRTVKEIVKQAYAGELIWIHDQLDGTGMVKESIQEVKKEMDATEAEINAHIVSLLERLKDREEAYESAAKNRDGLTHFAVPISAIDDMIREIKGDQ